MSSGGGGGGSVRHKGENDDDVYSEAKRFMGESGG